MLTVWKRLGKKAPDMQQLPLHLLLLRSQAAMHREIMAEAARLKLSPGQPKILEYLLQTGESNQKAIALHCEIEPATVGSILTRMERDGLIARAQHAGNRRSLYVTLTEKGLDAARTMDQAFRRADSKALAGLSAAQQQELCDMLQHVCDALSVEKGRE